MVRRTGLTGTGLRTIGLRCPASLEGVEAALLETDGTVVTGAGPFRLLPHPPALQRALRAALEAGPDGDGPGATPEHLAARLAERCAGAVSLLLPEGAAAGGIAMLGFDGPALPGQGEEGPVPLLGAAALARRLGLPVAGGFGGGLPADEAGRVRLSEAYAAMTAALPRPLAVLDLDGVARLHWIGPLGESRHFETGPAGGPAAGWAAWAREEAGEDRSGRLAMMGRADGAVMARLMAQPWLHRPPGPELDREGFERALRRAGAMSLLPADGAAAVVAYAALCVASAARWLPAPPRQWLLAGRGRVNAALRRSLSAVLEAPVRTVDAVGFDGMAFPAQSLAVLAARVARRGAPASPPRSGWQTVTG
jgi:anhydro-N-acetylmuramic acid kinase